MGRSFFHANPNCTDNFTPLFDSVRAWRFPLPHRIVKFVYVRRRNDEDPRGRAERDQWRDKSLIFLDENG